MLKNSGIPDAIAEAMIQRGYEKLTPVQEEVVKTNPNTLTMLVHEIPTKMNEILYSKK